MKKENQALLLLLLMSLATVEARRTKASKRPRPAAMQQEDEGDIIEILPRKRTTTKVEGHFVRPVKSVEEFETLKKETPLLFVDFWADYCGVCKMMVPDIQELSIEYKDKITFVSVDVGQNKLIPLGKKYAPSSLPTYMLTLNGTPFETMTGSQVKEGLQIYLNKMIKEAEKKGITPQPAQAPSVVAAPSPTKPVAVVNTEKSGQPITVTIETDRAMSPQVVKTGKSTVIELKEQ